jgi:hypothetical protein
MASETIGIEKKLYRIAARRSRENNSFTAQVQFDLGALDNKGRTVWIDKVQLTPVEKQR